MGNETSAMGRESSSTHRSTASAGVHRFTIDGHSRAARSRAFIWSKPFWVGGYEWAILYYPNGTANAGGEHTSVFLALKNAGEAKVTTSFTFSCLQDPASPAAEERRKVVYATTFTSKACQWGSVKFISKADLVPASSSGCLKDDRLVIKCTVEVITTELTYGDDQDSSSFVGPPSDLTQQLGHLLESGDATDIAIDVGGIKEVKAHRCVLTARSPVFRAMLCGSMMESKETNICVEDMEPSVFEVLLHYMYHDDLPSFMKDACTEEAITMAQHVLAAADRYGVERLKLICESMLGKTMDVYTVCSTLGFADRHNSERLKNCCLTYMLKDRERLKAIVKTEGFLQLCKNSASVARELFEKTIQSN
jgi:speckle-type POZ protein